MSLYLLAVLKDAYAVVSPVSLAGPLIALGLALLCAAAVVYWKDRAK